MIGAIVTAIAIWLSYTYQLVAIFPSSLQLGSVHSARCRHANRQRRERRNQLGANHLLGVTNGIKDVVTATTLDPLQSLLDNSPWWLTFVAITAIARLSEAASQRSSLPCVSD